MGRFEHLEIRDATPPPGTPGAPDVIDQHACMAEAGRAFAAEAFERALAFYSRALQYDVHLSDAWCGQVRCLVELNEFPEAITWSDRALERFPNAPDVLAARAQAEGRISVARIPTAMGFLDSAFAAKQVSPYVWVVRGETLLAANPANARACFLKAIEPGPRDPDVRVWTARSCVFRRQHAHALEHLRVATEARPEHPVAWFWLGHCHETLGETDKAMRDYRRALAADPYHRPARDAIHRLEHAGMLTRLGRLARRTFRRKET